MCEAALADAHGPFCWLVCICQVLLAVLHLTVVPLRRGFRRLLFASSAALQRIETELLLKERLRAVMLMLKGKLARVTDVFDKHQGKQSTTEQIVSGAKAAWESAITTVVGVYQRVGMKSKQ